MNENPNTFEPIPDQELTYPREKSLHDPELSPEIVEQIMGKVQDIDAKGTAFTSVISVGSRGSKVTPEENRPQVRQNVLAMILRAGVFGGEFRRNQKIPATPLEYHKHLKGGRTSVWFNIIGRMREFRPPDQKMKNSVWFHPGGISLIFSLDGYKEVPPDHDGESPKPKTFKGYGIPFSIDYKNPEWSKILAKYNIYNEEGLLNADSDQGFILSPRIPPKRMLGIVFKADEGQTSESWEGLDRNPYLPPTAQELEQRAGEIAQVMLEVYKDRPDFLLPIYDADGNLYWPKKMDHETIKQFVETRKK